MRQGAISANIDKVTYADTLPWPVSADGHGDFLILIDPNLDNSLPESRMAADNFVGVSEHSPSVMLKACPNPTSGIIRVECELPMNAITVTDIQGRTIMNIPANGELSVQLDLSPYPAGVYFIRVSTCKGTYTMNTMKR